MASIRNLSKSNLMDYRPYSLSRQKNNDVYVDIIFQDEGIMSVPKASGSAIIELLNEAFNKGVKMTLNSPSQIQTEPIETKFTPMSMPQEEEHPINRQVKRL